MWLCWTANLSSKSCWRRLWNPFEFYCYDNSGWKVLIDYHGLMHNCKLEGRTQSWTREPSTKAKHKGQAQSASTKAEHKGWVRKLNSEVQLRGSAQRFSFGSIIETWHIGVWCIHWMSGWVKNDGQPGGFRQATTSVWENVLLFITKNRNTQIHFIRNEFWVFRFFTANFQFDQLLWQSFCRVQERSRNISSA